MVRFSASVLCAIALLLQGCASGPTSKAFTPLDVPGARGPLPVYLYKPTSPFRGVVLFASGDGGWKSFEDKICQELAVNGFCVIGWDCRKYADAGAYTQAILMADFAAAIREGSRAAGSPDKPLILAGFSTGAEQAVAAAAGKPRLSGLRGVLVIAPGERGRYGITTSDLMCITPQGEGSFALTEHSPGLAGLRLFQIHGEHDPLSQTHWLGSLTIPHKLKVYPNGWHTFQGGPPDFLALVVKAADWLLDEN